jgi:UDP-N-acetyl-alpha-D-muramoyl-L-alanyl-L-glutamate epimerase
MKSYEVFRFLDYAWDAGERTVTMRYGLDDEIIFSDRVRFEFELVKDYSEAALDRVLRSLWLINGVSYYKAAMTPRIVVEGTQLTADEAAFLSETYRLGLGQLVYENQLHIKDVAAFEATDGATTQPVTGLGEGGSLVGLGG